MRTGQQTAGARFKPLAIGLICLMTAGAYAQLPGDITDPLPGGGDGGTNSSRDFENPSSNDTSQQLELPGVPATGTNVQRNDTPTDPEYDAAEDDDQDGGPSASDVFDERFDLFGFAPDDTKDTAIYKDGPNAPNAMVSGFNAAGAWKLTRGRPDVTIAILDTGVDWSESSLRTQVALNEAELPRPQDSDGNTDSSAAANGYDLNGNGHLDVGDYDNDPRVSDANGNGQIDGGDLIAAFSDGTDADNNGFVDDIAGWDFFRDDNNPFDQSSYYAAENHGTGRMKNAVEQGDDGEGALGVCPDCQFVPIRIWDSFVSDPNTFAMGILYAAANGVSVIEGANGSLGHTAFAEAASQYAYDQGVVQTYSGDDLNTANHNYPANYSHTMLIQGTAADVKGLGTDLGQQAASGFSQLGIPLPGTQLPVGTYFRSANTAQYGGHSSISMEGSTGSANTGKASGAAGMVVAAAKDAGTDLKPDETRIIMEQTAEDILAANTAGTGMPDPAQPGWDFHFGYGRVNLGAAVSLAASDNIPPIAAIYSPAWYAPLTSDSVTIEGRASARFADGDNFHWELQVGLGPRPRSFETVNQGDSSATVTNFGTIDLAAVRDDLDSFTVRPDSGGPTFSPTEPNPHSRQFTVRLVVDGQGLDTPGMDRRIFAAFTDDTLRDGFPKKIGQPGTGGEAPLKYANLNADNKPELVVPGEDGKLRILEPDGSALPGFPVQTDIQYQAAPHLDAPGFADLPDTAAPREVPRGAAVADLDDDGIPEIIDTAGLHIYVWQADGSRRDGFPVSLNRRFCRPEIQEQPDVHRKCGFLGSPAVGHLEGPDNPPAIVAAGLDGHLYAFRPDGSSLPGFPVNLVDPNQPSGSRVLAASVNSPALGDLNGDGADDIVIASNESYAAQNPDFGTIAGGEQQVLVQALAQAAGGSNRVYAIDGTNGEILDGWPIALNGVIQTILPLIGPGHNAAIATLSSGQKAIAVSTTGGAVSLYAPDGSKLRAMQQSTFGPASNATDRSGVLNLFEYATFGDVDGTGTVDVVHYGLTLSDAANLLLVGQNLPYNHLIGAYDANAGTPLAAYPVITDDFQLLSSSNIGKVTSGVSNQILAGTGLGLVHAYDGVTGTNANSNFPKQTDGWLFAPPEVSRDSRLAAITREGFLFQWNLADGPACQPEWPTFRHDLHQTGNYDADGTPPGAVRNLSATRGDDGQVTVQFKAPGDNSLCPDSNVQAYRISADGNRLDNDGPTPKQAGMMQTVSLDTSASNITVQGIDEADNLGFPVSAQVSGQPDNGGGGDTGDGSGSGGNSDGDNDGGSGSGAGSGDNDNGGSSGNGGSGGGSNGDQNAGGDNTGGGSDNGGATNGGGDNDNGGSDTDGGSGNSDANADTDRHVPDGADKFPFDNNGCTMAATGTFDPMWALLLVLAIGVIGGRTRRVTGKTPTAGKR